MITELSIRNFAIIDDISITFHNGLTVLTGETGAGKSIIIDAVHLLTGGRGSVEYVRHGAQKAEITGLFSIEAYQSSIYDLAENYGISIEDGMLILERTITKQGKSICRVNHKLVTLTILREFGQSIVNIHSQ
ncbi:MAG TPA: AAA family ATPase, partial [Bacillota bacterium]|nr:AAA family ATPase [Bacillota bacterium]